MDTVLVTVDTVLVTILLLLKRHRDEGNLYERKNLMGGLLAVSEP